MATVWTDPFAFCSTGNARPVAADLRDATKPLLAATAGVLGGVLPRHVAPTADGEGTSDWLWAAGDSPLVATSPCRASFGQVDADIIHRNYLAQALRVSPRPMSFAHKAYHAGTPSTLLPAVTCGSPNVLHYYAIATLV